MNIIIDELTADALFDYGLDSIEFGSALHGTKTEESDTDMLHIIEPSSMWLTAPYNTDHLLQYKEDNTDHIFCTPNTFVNGLVNGDAAIFHEILRKGGLKGTCLEWLEEYNFNHYKILRAYLGLARRDLKEVTKLWKDERKAKKKLRFALENYNFVAPFVYQVPTLYEDVNQWPELKEGENLPQALHKLTRQALERLDWLRDDLNTKIELGEIPRTLTEEAFESIDMRLDEKFTIQEYVVGLDYFRKSHINGN